LGCHSQQVKHAQHHAASHKAHHPLEWKLHGQQAAVNAQHEHHAGVFIKALNRNRATRGKQFKTSVLKQCIHGNHEHAACKSSDQHQRNGHPERGGKRQCWQRQTQPDAQGHDFEGVLQGDPMSCHCRAKNNPKGHYSLQQTGFFKGHVQGFTGP